jgi:hypothetical protein
MLKVLCRKKAFLQDAKIRICSCFLDVCHWTDRKRKKRQAEISNLDARQIGGVPIAGK